MVKVDRRQSEAPRKSASRTLSKARSLKRSDSEKVSSSTFDAAAVTKAATIVPNLFPDIRPEPAQGRALRPHELRAIYSKAKMLKRQLEEQEAKEASESDDVRRQSSGTQRMKAMMQCMVKSTTDLRQSARVVGVFQSHHKESVRRALRETLRKDMCLVKRMVKLSRISHTVRVGKQMRKWQKDLEMMISDIFPEDIGDNGPIHELLREAQKAIDDVFSMLNDIMAREREAMKLLASIQDECSAVKRRSEAFSTDIGEEMAALQRLLQQFENETNNNSSSSPKKEKGGQDSLKELPAGSGQEDSEGADMLDFLHDLGIGDDSCEESGLSDDEDGSEVGSTADSTEGLTYGEITEIEGKMKQAASMVKAVVQTVSSRPDCPELPQLDLEAAALALPGSDSESAGMSRSSSGKSVKFNHAGAAAFAIAGRRRGAGASAESEEGDTPRSKTTRKMARMRAELAAVAALSGSVEAAVNAAKASGKGDIWGQLMTSRRAVRRMKTKELRPVETVEEEAGDDMGEGPASMFDAVQSAIGASDEERSMHAAPGLPETALDDKGISVDPEVVFRAMRWERVISATERDISYRDRHGGNAKPSDTAGIEAVMKERQTRQAKLLELPAVRPPPGASGGRRSRPLSAHVPPALAILPSVQGPPPMLSPPTPQAAQAPPLPDVTPRHRLGQGCGSLLRRCDFRSRSDHTRSLHI